MNLPTVRADDPRAKTVVVIDDVVDLVDSVVMVLQLEGYHALGATDGPRGIRQAEVESADLVILDYMIPMMDGAAIGHALRAHATLAGVRILMCSATPEAIVRRAFDGYDAFLTKPVFPDDFLGAVRRLIGEPTAQPT